MNEQEKREKVIKALEECLNASCRGFQPGRYCPIEDDVWETIDEALALLKAQKYHTVTIGFNPDVDEYVKKVANLALDEFVYQGKTIREWVETLKAQEPRVMTFDEIVAATPGTAVWLEDYDKTDVIAGLVKKVYIYTKVIDFLIVNEKVNDEVTADLDTYSEGWRCWTTRPTDEQREAVKWDD